LTLWYAAVVVVAIGLVLAAVRTGMRLVLLSEVDHFLEQEAAELELAIRDFGDDSALREEFDRKTRGHVDRGMFARWIDEEAQTRLTSGPTFPGDGPRIATVSHPLRIPAGRGGTLIVGQRLDGEYIELNRLTQLLLFVGGSAAILAPMGGYWLSGRVTKPLGEVIDTAARLHPAQLAERLPVLGTGDELDRLAQTVNGMLDRISHHLLWQRAFVDNAAHELRSPLTAIQSSLEVALSQDRSTAEYQDILVSVTDQCVRLSRLVNELLLLAELDSQGLPAPRQSVSLKDLVTRSLAAFRVVAEERRIQLSLGWLSDVLVRGDADRLWQVINNLLDNAIRFTPAGGTISVQVTQEANTPYAVLSITDTGPGIAPEDLPFIFDRFFQGGRGRSRRAETRGSGLGLSICHAIVIQHGGTIRVESPPPIAARYFTCRCPSHLRTQRQATKIKRRRIPTDTPANLQIPSNRVKTGKITAIWKLDTPIQSTYHRRYPPVRRHCGLDPPSVRRQAWRRPGGGFRAMFVPVRNGGLRPRTRTDLHQEAI
jgi:heavy metal sensor kinase